MENTNLLTRLRNFFSTSSYSRTLSILALLIIAAAVPLTLSNLSQEQDIRQRASGASASFGDCKRANGTVVPNCAGVGEILVYTTWQNWGGCGDPGVHHDDCRFVGANLCYKDHADNQWHMRGSRGNSAAGPVFPNGSFAGTERSDGGMSLNIEAGHTYTVALYEDSYCTAGSLNCINGINASGPNLTVSEGGGACGGAERKAPRAEITIRGTSTAATPNRLDHCAASDNKKYISSSRASPSITCTGWDGKRSDDPTNTCGTVDPLNGYYYASCTGTPNIRAEIKSVSPQNPGDNDDVTVTFRVSGDTNYVNLWVGGPNDAKDNWGKNGADVVQVETLDPTRTYSITWPKNHPAHINGARKVGILPYYSFRKAESGDFENIGGPVVSQDITIGGGGGSSGNPSGTFDATCSVFEGAVQNSNEVDFWLEKDQPGNAFAENRFLGSATPVNGRYTFNTSDLNTVPNDPGKTYNPRTSFFAGTPRSVSAFALKTGDPNTHTKLGVKLNLTCIEETVNRCQPGACGNASSTYPEGYYVRTPAGDADCAARTNNQFPLCYLTTTPTPTQATDATTLSLDVKLGGIGKSVGENPDPKTKTKDIAVCIYALSADPTNDAEKCSKAALTKTGSLTYSNGRYSSAIFNIGDTLATGRYQVFVKSGKYLRKRIAGTPTITAGTTSQMDQTTLTTGDINGDNRVDILDYEILRICFEDKANSAACGSNKALANLDDDTGDKVDGADYRLFVKSLSVKEGD